MIRPFDKPIERLSEEVAARLDPFEEAIAHLDTIPGINRRVAEVVLAEIGPDMSKFADGKHLTSWLGLCPGNRESGGKRLSGRMGKGNKAARRVLIQAAQAAMHIKQTKLSAVGQDIKGRRGIKVAVGAVAHRIVLLIYEVLSKGGGLSRVSGAKPPKRAASQCKCGGAADTQVRKAGLRGQASSRR